MKRNPKPFAVEVKRSRRSPSSSNSPQAVATDGGKIEADDVFFAAPFKAAGLGEQLVVPAFLQSAKDVRRRSSKDDVEPIPDKAQVFRTIPASQPVESPREAERVTARILPSLAPESMSAFETTCEAKNEPTPNQELVKAQPKAKSPRRSKPKSPVESPIETSFFEPESDVEPFDAAEPNAFAYPPQELRLTRVRGFLNRRRDATSLPVGQRWKRRLHPRAW